MSYGANIPSSRDVRLKVEQAEKLATHLSIQLTAEGKRMRDALDLYHTFPNDAQYRRSYENYKEDWENYQQQYEGVLREIKSLKTLLAFVGDPLSRFVDSK